MNAQLFYKLANGAPLTWEEVVLLRDDPQTSGVVKHWCESICGEGESSQPACLTDTPLAAYMKASGLDGDLLTRVPAEEDIRDDEPTHPAVLFAARIGEMLERMSVQVIDLIENTKAGRPRVKIAQDDIQRIRDIISSFTTELGEMSHPFIEQMIDVGGNAGMVRLTELPDRDSSWDVQNPEVQLFIDNYSLALAGSVTQATADAVTRSVGLGLAAGDTPREIAQRVQSTGSFDSARASMIARTESARAYVEGQHVAWDTSGVVAGKRWLLAPHACPTCQALEKAFNNRPTPVGTREAVFNVGDTFEDTEGATITVRYAAMTGPPGHPNCRCDTEPVLDL